LTSKPKLAGLLLAAGASIRLGKPKQLVTFRSESLVKRAARSLLTQTPNVFVVIGAEAAQVGQQLKGLPVRIVRNDDWQKGMASSIACGVSEVSEDFDGVLILLCDQWRIAQKDLKELINVWKENPAIPVVARWSGSYGSPAIFPHHLFDELRHLQGDRGAKALVARQSEVHFVDMHNAQFDLDTRADLQFLLDSTQINTVLETNK
jgi:molybdenum cofactor cytidylyltransferase